MSEVRALIYIDKSDSVLKTLINPLNYDKKLIFLCFGILQHLFWFSTTSVLVRVKQRNKKTYIFVLVRVKL